MYESVSPMYDEHERCVASLPRTHSLVLRRLVCNNEIRLKHEVGVMGKIEEGMTHNRTTPRNSNWEKAMKAQIERLIGPKYRA